MVKKLIYVITYISIPICKWWCFRRNYPHPVMLSPLCEHRRHKDIINTHMVSHIYIKAPVYPGQLETCVVVCTHILLSSRSIITPCPKIFTPVLRYFVNVSSDISFPIMCFDTAVF